MNNEDELRQASYTRWLNMMDRCYGQNKTETYQDASVCDKWHDFEQFHLWHKKHNDPTVSLQLDKDLIVSGNKHYSPATCVLVPRELNMLVVIPRVEKQKHLPGVIKTQYNYGAVCNGERLGFFDTELEAHKAWQLDMVRQLVVWSKAYKQTNALLSRSLQRRASLIKTQHTLGEVTQTIR